ncbi:hypothetical protein J6590_027646 [Homalodisca vitripennis]|nr:hypothetical protein J6590_027646 [Homalodisca vitripennis]
MAHTEIRSFNKRDADEIRQRRYSGLHNFATNDNTATSISLRQTSLDQERRGISQREIWRSKVAEQEKQATRVSEGADSSSPCQRGLWSFRRARRRSLLVIMHSCNTPERVTLQNM